MTIHNLHYMFNPSSIVLLWAEQSQNPIGEVVARNLLSSGFQGDIFIVSETIRNFEGIFTYPEVDRLPKSPDLAVIIGPLSVIPWQIDKLSRFGVRSAVIITDRFQYDNNEMKCVHDNNLGAARSNQLRILGPDSKGVMVPGVGLNAGLAHIQPLKGNLAFISQSGSVMAAVLDWATSNKIGFSHAVSVGDMVDVDFADMLDYLSIDYNTKAILLYIESITYPRKFMSAARAAARMKPVIVIKAGCHVEGSRSAYRQYGRIVATDDVYDAAFQRAGILRVKDIQSLFDSVETLSMTHAYSGDRLAILTNGGGVGTLAADDLIKRNGRLADLSERSKDLLNTLIASGLPCCNPVNILEDAPPTRYRDAIKILLEDDGVDALLVINSPSATSSCAAVAQTVADLFDKSESTTRNRPIFTCWLGANAVYDARNIIKKSRLPTFETPTEAIRGFMQTVRYHRSREMLMETPPNIPESFEPESWKVNEIIESAFSEGRAWLSEEEVKAVLMAYKIPMVDVVDAKSFIQAGKIGVAWNSVAIPKNNWLWSTHASNLFIGMREDVQFGPVIMFGEGMSDKAIALPPLNMHLARDVINRADVHFRFEGRGEISAVDTDGIAMTLVKVSQLICDTADIAELEINPLLADEKNVWVQNARIRVHRSPVSADRRLVISPYPKDLEKKVTLPDGQHFLLRPIRPEDEPAFQSLFSKLTQDEIRLRFLHAMRYLSHNMAARLTQIDYDREMALVLCDPSGLNDKMLYGMVRITADPDNDRAEFDILVHHEMTGMGLGPMLLRRIIECARKRGIREIFGEVLAENGPMLKLCDAFGFKKRCDPDDPGVVIVTLIL